jgi:4-hydroxy-tetrahydrodipicolinate synthase
MRPEPVFTGVGVALATLYEEDGSVDVVATRDHALRLVDLGVQAVIVAGTTGEAAMLGPAEVIALLEGIRQAVTDVPVIAGTGASRSGKAADLTAEAVKAGADAVLVMPPSGLTDPAPYFGRVASAAGSVPILAYHFPRVSAPGIPVELLPQLPVVGIKDSSGDAERLLQEVAQNSRNVYVGSSALLTMAGAVGASGAILALANAEPTMCIEAFRGDAAAQVGLIESHLKAKSRTPHGLKELMAARFGTSRYSRAD